MDDAVHSLVRFHTRHKLLLLAHSPEHYRALGRLVASVRRDNAASFSLAYAVGLVAAMQRSPTPGRHANVLQHIAGYLRDHLTEEARRGLSASIAAYQAGAVPLEVPLGMVADFARDYEIDYLCQQVYLEPYLVRLAKPSLQ